MATAKKTPGWPRSEAQKATEKKYLSRNYPKYGGSTEKRPIYTQAMKRSEGVAKRSFRSKLPESGATTSTQARKCYILFRGTQK